jgi:hypothetical protein
MASWHGQYVPRLTEPLILAAGGAVRAQVEVLYRGEGAYWNQVPGIVRHNVGGEEINVSGGEYAFTAGAARGADAVKSPGLDGDGAYLQAINRAVRVHDEVIGRGFAVGL